MSKYLLTVFFCFLFFVFFAQSQASCFPLIPPLCKDNLTRYLLQLHSLQTWLMMINIMAKMFNYSFYFQECPVRYSCSVIHKQCKVSLNLHLLALRWLCAECGPIPPCHSGSLPWTHRDTALCLQSYLWIDCIVGEMHNFEVKNIL